MLGGLELAALLNGKINFCLRGALRAPLKQKFIPEISKAEFASFTLGAVSATQYRQHNISRNL
jgi:hypothetical protein